MKREHSTLYCRRKYMNITQKELAKKIGISSSYYSQIENYKRELSYKLAIKIAFILGTFPDEIFLNDYRKHYNV